uniref:Putative acyl-CoA-binding domain-containing protein 3-like n=1 Tax=Davidia involucrata TaxID=16924 RepID=A0A5B6ZV66_DAVIN
MELFQELLMTALFALTFSFLVAKLVSIAMAGDDVRDSSKSVDFETVTEEVKFERGLRVQSTKTKRRVQFVDEVKTLDEFEGEESVDKLESSRFGDELAEKRCDSAEICDSACRLEVEEGVVEVSEVVGLPENSSEGGFDKEEVVAEIVGGLEFGVKEENRVIGFDGLVVEERSDSTKAADEFDRAIASMDVEENIVDNARDDDEIDVELARDDDVVDQIEPEEVRGVESGENQESGIEGGLNKGDEEEELDGDEDDDWEGIEKSELEKVFAAASNYVGCGGKDDRLANVGSDVQMLLYGLHKVAMEGPCHESQPMALKVSARANWNAWQRLGNMSPEVAMEQYVNLLSDTVPGWMESDPAGDGKQDFSQAGIPGAPDSNMNIHNQPNLKEYKLELKSGTDGGDLTGGSNSVNREKE